jgi:hypothetical protein
MAPIDPNNPGGPPQQQPTPNVAASDMMANLSQLAANQAAVAAAFKAMSANVADMSKELGDVVAKVNEMGTDMGKNVKHIDDFRSGLKGVSREVSQIADDMLSSKDFEKTDKSLKKVRETLIKIQAAAAPASKEFNASNKSLDLVNKALEKFKGNVRLNNTELGDMNKLMRELAKTAEGVSDAFKNMSLNHLTRQIHSISRNFATLGIGKKFSRNMDKYTAGAEIRENIKKHKADREAGNVEGAHKRKQQIMDTIKRQYPTLDPSLLTTPGTPARAEVGKRMGLRGKMHKKFIEGDETGAFQHGGGGGIRALASKAAGAMEDATGGAMGMAAEAAPVLALLELVREAFDKQAAQNKTMESSLGKAGLFGGIYDKDGDTGFDRARGNLNARSANPLQNMGLTFDRNMKIAAGLSEGGRGLSEVRTGGGENRAGGQFGPGGFGQVQRIAAGAGRVAGLTDTESVQQTLKMLDQYNQTLESSEDFFIKVKSGADAAGISTMKYIGLIDDVNSHFNRMNKSLDQTMNMLGQLSKTGRLGAEDLKQYMDFLTTGGPSKGMADVPLNAYAMMNESSDRSEMRTKLAKYGLTSAITAAGPTGAKMNLTDEQITSLQGPDAQSTIQQLEYALTQNTSLSESQRQSQEGAIKRMKLASAHFARVSAGGGAINQALGQTMDQSPAEVAMKNQDLLEKAVTGSGGSMADYMRMGPAKFAVEHPTFTGRLPALGLTSENAMQQWMGQGQASATMLSNFGKVDKAGGMVGEESTQTVESAKAFLRELTGDQKLKLKLDDTTLADLNESPEKMAKWFRDNGDKLSGKDFSVASMQATFGYVQNMRTAGKDVSGDREAALEAARKISFRTQDTGEMIANAFSKWFIDIIGLITRILDKMNFGATSDETRAAAKKITDTPEFQAQLASSIEKLDKKGAEAHLAAQDTSKSPAELAALRKTEEDSRDESSRLRRTPQTAKEALAQMAEMANVGQQAVKEAYGDRIVTPTRQTTPKGSVESPSVAATRTAWEIAAKIKSGNMDNIAGQTMGDLSGLPGVTIDTKTGEVTFDAAASKNLSSLIEQLTTSHAATQVGGVDAQGGTHLVVNNMFSAQITQQQPADNALRAKAAKEAPTAAAQTNLQ